MTIRHSLVLEVSILILLSLIYFWACVPDLGYVAIHRDEAVVGNLGINLLKGQNLGYYNSININIFGKIFPINLFQEYTFALPHYIVIPFFLLFGISIYSLKLAFIIVSYLGAIALYFLLRYIFDLKIALLTVLLLILSPSYVDFNRVSLKSTEPLLNVLFWSGALFLVNYVRSKKSAYLYLAALLLGAGLSVKLSMVSRYIGLAVAVLAVYRVEARLIYERLTARQLFLTAVYFCLGAIFFIYFNVSTKGSTFALISDLLGNRSHWNYSSDNLNYLENISTRVAQFSHLLKDNIFSIRENSGWVNIFKECQFWVFWSSLAFGILLFFRRGDNSKVIFLCVLFVSMFATMIYSPSTWSYYHLPLMYPFPQLMIALFICKLYDLPEPIPFKAVKVVALTITLAVIICKTALLINYHNNYLGISSRMFTSDESMEKLSEFINHNNLDPVFMFTDSLEERYVLHNKGSKTNNYINEVWCLPALNEGLDRTFKKYRSIYVVCCVSKNDINYNMQCYSDWDNSKSDWLHLYVKQHKMRIEYFGCVKDKENMPLYEAFKVY